MRLATSARFTASGAKKRRNLVDARQADTGWTAGRGDCLGSASETIYETGSAPITGSSCVLEREGLERTDALPSFAGTLR